MLLCLAGGRVMYAQQARWVGTWASAQMLLDGPDVGPDDFKDATLREVVHVSAGGSRIRLHFSNAFGTAPLQIQMVHVAKPASVANCRIDAATDKPLRFAGNTAVVIPPGAEYLSDPIDFPVAPLSDLAVTLYFETPSVHQTGHNASHTTSCLGARNTVSAADMPDAKKFQHWFYLAGVEVESSPSAAAVVTLGDSITDGTASTLNGNDRWPDVLAARLQGDAAKRNWSVLNVGIGGNRVLHDGTGPSALARFDEDVLAQSGVKYMIILESINDIGHAADPKKPYDVVSADDLIAGLTQLAERAHMHGIKVFGATLTPYSGAGYMSPAGEEIRKAVNKFIRTSSFFDGVIDFEAATMDKTTGAFQAAFDRGDHLHPNDAGLEAMGSAVDLKLFTEK